MNRNLRKRAAVDYTYWDISYNKPRRNRAFKNMCKKLGRKKFQKIVDKEVTMWYTEFIEGGNQNG